MVKSLGDGHPNHSEEALSRFSAAKLQQIPQLTKSILQKMYI